MKRWLLFIILLLTSSVAFAQNVDLPSFFQPAEEDLSIWYLGNIFGRDLIPGASDVRLLSVLFGIFNQVVLVVGIIIVVYTIMAGTLNTANEGKPLGEKWNSVWMPVRISMGIAMLVPKGGSGYNLAQYLVMWLTLQGVGAADTLWTTMIDYFAQGGAIYSGTTSRAGAYMNQPNVSYAYYLQGSNDLSLSTSGKVEQDTYLLQNMVCIEAFNNDKDRVELAGGEKYSLYVPQGSVDRIHFGTRSNDGTQCGVVTAVPDMNDLGSYTKEQYDTRARVYAMGLYNMAKGLEGIAKEIGKNGENSEWDGYFSDVRRNAELFVNYIVGYDNILYDRAAAEAALNATDAFETYKKYGWILAGNYYTILSSYSEEAAYVLRQFRRPAEILYTAPADINSTSSPSYKYYGIADVFFDEFMDLGESYYYDIEGMGEFGALTGGKLRGGKRTIGPVDMDEILSATQSSLTKSAFSTAGSSMAAGQAAGAEAAVDAASGKKAKKKQKKQKKGGGAKKANRVTNKAVQDFITYMTGTGGAGDLRVAKDPILKISIFGKDLTIAGLTLILIAAPLLTAINIGAICMGITPQGHMLQAVGYILIPQLMAMGLFLYAQGAVLGVFIPLIPYVTFFIGAIGWVMQVVESVAAAPLVAIGLIFPETRDDIWGRAAPAYMLILNLFLRPSLMIIGFAAAMIVTWMFVELLNIGFITLTATTFRIEDMFGFAVILFAYTAMFTVVVTKAYSLINVVPNKVLHWIGDQSMGVQGAEEAIGSAKQATEAGGQAVAAGASAIQSKAEGWRASGEVDKALEGLKGTGGQAGGQAKKQGNAKQGQITGNPNQQGGSVMGGGSGGGGGNDDDSDTSSDAGGDADQPGDAANSSKDRDSD